MSSKRYRNRALQPQQPPRGRPQLTSIQYSESRSGPLPHPADLERYEHLVPGMAERLLSAFEKQTEHRMGIERALISADIRRGHWGLIAAFVVGLLALAAGVLFVVAGHEGAGATTIIVEMIGFAGLFIYGNETKRKERSDKAMGR